MRAGGGGGALKIFLIPTDFSHISYTSLHISHMRNIFFKQNSTSLTNFKIARKLHVSQRSKEMGRFGA